MGYLSSEDQQLILDFYFRCGSEEDIARGRDLIACNPEASNLYANLEDSLKGLDDGLKYEPCPDNLVDLTLARLKLTAAPKPVGSSKLQDLLKQEQTNRQFAPAAATEIIRPSRFWRPAFEIMATAAGILLVAGILFPSFGAMRERSRQIACANNLRQIGQSMASFTNDNNERLCETQVQAGSPWWKIGYQGPETQSNTRYVWQLVKGGYVDGRVFVCDGDIQGDPVRYNAQRMGDLNDFPSRRNVSYSFILLCDENNKLTRQSRRVIAADLNPLFQKVSFQPAVYQKLDEFSRVQLNEQLRQMMSGNHRHRGQSALYCDGSVAFIKTRIVDNDDIFTIQNVDTYTGKESPRDPKDVFLVP